MRAVASLEMRMRVVASIEISNSQGSGSSIYASGSRAYRWRVMASRQGRDWLSPFSTPESDTLRALPNWQ